MDNEKRSFLFYFDNYPMVQSLPPEQRGWLLSALCVYAEGVWRDETITMEQVMDGFPQMSREARVACGFIGGTILRDTQRWLKQRRARQEWKAARPRQGSQDQQSRQLQREREDMDRMRRLMERMEREEAGE